MNRSRVTIRRARVAIVARATRCSVADSRRRSRSSSRASSPESSSPEISPRCPHRRTTNARDGRVVEGLRCRVSRRGSVLIRPLRFGVLRVRSMRDADAIAGGRRGETDWRRRRAATSSAVAAVRRREAAETRRWIGAGEGEGSLETRADGDAGRTSSGGGAGSAAFGGGGALGAGFDGRRLEARGR